MDYAESAASEAEEATDGDKLDLLILVRGEMPRAIGFDQDAELRDDREQALLYYKGDVSKDIPTLPNRSKAVSSDVSDAIETLLPDLIEIFIGGDDVVSFIPQGAKDVEAAKQETAYLHHVAFQENPGFLNLYTAIKDALLLKTGIFHWEWAEDIEDNDEEFTGKNAVELALAGKEGEVSNVKPETEGVDLRFGEQTYSFTVTKRTDNSKARYWAVAPDDFAVAPDTVNIAETTYCCERQRPRVQDLIAQGFDEDKVRALPTYGATDSTLDQARDTAGENEVTGGAGDETSDDLRQVEIRKHCIRVLDGTELKLWCIYTDATASTEVHREEIEAIPYAVGSPYLVAHRMIGRSVADLLIEVMKIKTALYRMCLDAGYFALNQRNAINMQKANEFTLSDLLRNEPSAPVRTNGEGCITPLQAGPLNFDPYAAIEFFSTVAEGRTGVVRNAQGLNPDTLHDTKGGMMALLSAAQKRTRMIARVLAETLVKPLFLGLHATIRQNSQATKEAQLLGRWVPVSPTKWAERNSMTVEVGLGAAGKDAEIAAVNQIALDMQAIVEVQGGAQGPLVFMKNVYKLATDKAKKLGVKAPEEYYTDPNSDEGKAAIDRMAQQPHPEVVKAQMEGQIKTQQMQQDGQIRSAQIQQDGQIKSAQSQADAALQQQKLAGELEMRRYQIDAEMNLKERQLVAELQLKERLALAEIGMKERVGVHSANVTSSVHPGGEPG